MKKYLLSFAIVALLFSCVAVYASSVNCPAVGIKTWGSSTDKLGCTGVDDNGARYKFIYNSSTEAITQHQPVFYLYEKVASADASNLVATAGADGNYQVSIYDAVRYASGESFAGTVYCDSTGEASLIPSGKTGWIQTGGVGTVEVIATNGHIYAGKKLCGYATTTSKALVLQTGTYTQEASGNTAAGYGWDGTYTSVGSANPIATSVYDSATRGPIRVILNGRW